MKTSEKGIDFIKGFESLSLKPYLDSVNVPTIGYGATFYQDGSKVTMFDKPLTVKEAEELLAFHLEEFESCVDDNLKEKELTQNQYDALVSFAFNLGCGNLKNSTLIKKVKNNPLDKTIYNEFLKWNKAGGKVLRGLTRRRIGEADMYIGK